MPPVRRLLSLLRRRLRRRPLDWTRGAGRTAAAARPESVDVIVPVYGAPDDLQRCLASVVAHTDLARHRLMLVIDGPQEERVEAVVSAFPATVLRNPSRLGFVRSVNRGMRASTADVVLLNSDTIVTARWLEKLIDAAMSTPDAATVTPHSNHATLVSIPRAFEENLLPEGWDLARFAAEVERGRAEGSAVSSRASSEGPGWAGREARVTRPSRPGPSLDARDDTPRFARTFYPRLPTGVGFCLYIRRVVLNDVGYFDEEHFGAGYGEENDFCFRALKRGWLHLLDDATFVWHAGGRSFGTAAAAQRRRGMRALRRLHPEYMATIAAYMDSVGLRPAWSAVAAATALSRSPQPPLRSAHVTLRNARDRGFPRPRKLRLPSNPAVAAATALQAGAITHLVHGWPPFARGGSEAYAAWLVDAQRATRAVSVYARIADPARAKGEAVEWLQADVRVRLVANNFVQRDPFSRNALRDAELERDFARFLDQERPALLHIHHLAGHAFSLARVARRRGIPIVQSLHDWWSMCARVNLLDVHGRRCSGPGLRKCARCVTLTRIPLANTFLHAARRAAARAALAQADAFVLPSQAIRDDFEREGLLPRGMPVHVIPYGVDTAPRAEVRPPAQLPLRFGCVGAVLPHKGFHLAAEAFRGLDPAQATLRIFGNTSVDPEYARSFDPSLLAGPFAEEEKVRLYDSLDVLIVPSIGLESFGLVAREAIARRVPVLAARDGALAELFADGPGGRFSPPAMRRRCARW